MITIFRVLQDGPDPLTFTGVRDPLKGFFDFKIQKYRGDAVSPPRGVKYMSFKVYYAKIISSSRLLPIFSKKLLTTQKKCVILVS